jgi:hypothetical protein
MSTVSTACRGVCLSAGLLAAAPAVQASVLWGPTSLPGTGTCPNGTITWASDPQQGQVFRTQVREVAPSTSNSERCEFAMPQGRVSNNQTIYVGWKSKVQTPNTGTWNGIFQAKCHGSHVADQPLVFSVRSGRLTLENHEDVNGKEVSREVWSASLPTGWFSIVMKIRYSESRTTGSVQLWFNGALQTLRNGRTTHNGQTWDGSNNNMHWGIYRRSSINGTEIHQVSRPRVATTLEEARP